MSSQEAEDAIIEEDFFDWWQHTLDLMGEDKAAFQANIEMATWAEDLARLAFLAGYKTAAVDFSSY